jgi:hypothetical protein
MVTIHASCGHTVGSYSQLHDVKYWTEGRLSRMLCMAMVCTACRDLYREEGILIEEAPDTSPRPLDVPGQDV